MDDEFLEVDNVPEGSFDVVETTPDTLNVDMDEPLDLGEDEPIVDDMPIIDDDEPIVDDYNEEDEPIVDDYNEEDEPIVDDQNEEDESIVDDQNEEDESIVDDYNEEDEPIVDDYNEEDEPIVDDQNEEDESIVDDQEEDEPIVDDQNEEDESIVDDQNEEEESIVDDYNEEDESIVDDQNEEDEPIVDDYNEEDESIVDDYNEENESIVDDYNEKDESIVDNQNEEDEPIVDDYNEEDESIVDDQNEEDEPIVDDYNEEDEPIVEDYNEEDESIVDDQNEEDESIVDVHNEEDEPLDFGDEGASDNIVTSDSNDNNSKEYIPYEETQDYNERKYENTDVLKDGFIGHLKQNVEDDAKLYSEDLGNEDASENKVTDDSNDNNSGEYTPYDETQDYKTREQENTDSKPLHEGFMEHLRQNVNDDAKQYSEEYNKNNVDISNGQFDLSKEESIVNASKERNEHSETKKGLFSGFSNIFGGKKNSHGADNEGVSDIEDNKDDGGQGEFLGELKGLVNKGPYPNDLEPEGNTGKPKQDENPKIRIPGDKDRHDGREIEFSVAENNEQKSEEYTRYEETENYKKRELEDPETLHEGFMAHLGQYVNDDNDLHIEEKEINNENAEKVKECNENLKEIQKKVNDYAEREKIIDCLDEDNKMRFKEKLERPLLETVENLDNYGAKKTYESMSKDEYSTNITGFNNGKKSYVNVEGRDAKEIEKTTLHENIHQLSANDVYIDNELLITRRGISINGSDCQINEGITEYYTKKTMGNDYPGDNTIYRDNTIRAEWLEQIVGKDTMLKAYYENKPGLISREFENTFGEDGKRIWEMYSRCCDVAVNSPSREERVMANDRADKILARMEVLKDLYKRRGKDGTV